MTGDEAVAWLASLGEGFSLSLIDATPTASATLAGRPAAMTVGFSGVDTGLTLDSDPSTAVRCELVCAAAQPPFVQSRAVAAAARELVDKGLAAQPGVLLEGLIDDLAVAGEPTVRHGFLREPQLFERGTPTYTEPGQLTLLLELVALTEEERQIAAAQGAAVLERRLRRRGVRVGDWYRGE
ncbi:suppressor of fused domain protein [Corynebacterium timonense]|uniref:Suppressor of fused protein (SUFU) n=1 Tax=Corynebacterium timonense TaxID=441500 RepID=A0A1H1TRB2_9CORY|nr:suppressor of fused domain protein [Corynebacterium timonense]SDS62476.1 Suppressor of fused protein (SUFU) [Corynebacterium timonense]